MKVLGLCSYPIGAAATRFRMQQFVEPLREKGIELDVRPFLDDSRFHKFYEKGDAFGKAFGLIRPLLARFGQVFEVGRYDLIFVQREAMFFGPAFFEWLYQRIGHVPMILDLDDATYVRYVSPSFGRAGSFFKFFGKTDRIIERADAIVCGNRFIAEYAKSKGAKAVVIPTIVDTSEFRPVEKNHDVPVIGWIGTHSTFPFLESILPVLERLAKKHRFVMKVVGSGQKDIRISGVETQNLDWELEREIEDFQTLDIGLYPIVVSGSANPAWLMGKSGFKAIQYLAVGVPFVMSPVGVCAEIGEPNRTHFNAESGEDWYNSLDSLLTDGELRKEIGRAGREHAKRFYSLPSHAATLASTMREVCDSAK